MEGSRSVRWRWCCVRGVTGGCYHRNNILDCQRRRSPIQHCRDCNSAWKVYCNSLDGDGVLDYGEEDGADSEEDDIVAAIDRLGCPKPVNGCDFPMETYGQDEGAIKEGSQLLLRVQEAESTLRVTNTAVFRSWLAFLFRCASRDGELPLSDEGTLLLSEGLVDLSGVELHALQFAPKLDAWGRTRGQKARQDLRGMFPDVGLWLLLDAMFRYVGGLEFLEIFGAIDKSVRQSVLREGVHNIVAALRAWLINVSMHYTTLTAWLAPYDGRRRTYSRKKCPEVTCSRYIDTMLVALQQWADTSVIVEKAFLELENGVANMEAAAWEESRQHLVEQLMLSMTKYDLLGLKSMESFSWQALCAYPLKIMFSDIMGLMRVRLHPGVEAARCTCRHCDRTYWIEKEYIFFGPSPRGLQQVVAPNTMVSDFDKLRWWRELLAFLNNVMGTLHTLYVPQMNPCEWRGYLRFVRKWSMQGVDALPDSHLTPTRLQVERLYRFEKASISLFFTHLARSGF